MNTKTFIKRTIHSLLLIICICIINFMLFFLSPGNPSNIYLNQDVVKSQVEKIEEHMGYEDPVHEQFINWASHLLKGDLGYSWSKHRPVNQLLKEAIPQTLKITLLSIILNILIGCFIGILTGIYANKWYGKILDFVTLIIYSTPIFLLSLFFIYIFSFQLNWLPPAGVNSYFIQDSNIWFQLGDTLKHLLLPVSILTLSGAAATSRFIKTEVNPILKSDYILMARAKGISSNRIFFHHILKNALIPVVSLLGIYFPFLLCSAFIVEVIFAWPGMGRITYEALFAKDLPVIMATNMIAAILVITGNFISDIIYKFIDPRISVFK